MLRSLPRLPIVAPVVAGFLGKREASRRQVTNTTRCDEEATIVSPLSSFSPYPPIRLLRPNENLEIAYDVRTRNPIYVLERLVVVDSSTPRAHRRPNFRESKDLPVVYRSQPQHYHKSGYDRGHMAPAADFLYDKKAYNDTFVLANVSPQDPVLNKKDWANLEEWTRQVAKKAMTEHGAITYVISGGLWLPKRQIGEKTFQYVYPALGTPPSLVSVPSHFFKVVVTVKNSQIVKYACFVLANAEPHSKRDLQDYLVRWTDLEAVTGLQFFPMLVDDTFKKKADQVTSTFLDQSSPVLLLTDGSQISSSSSSVRAKQRNAAVAEHLCDRNACRR